MRMRLRLPELLAEKRLTAHQVALKSGGRISLSTVYRLKGRGGQSGYFEAKILAALCDVFEITDLNDLLSRDDEAPPVPLRPAKGAKRKR